MARPHDEPVATNHLDPADRDPMAPAEDAVEQATLANPADAPDTPGPDADSAEVGEYDALEQSRAADFDDDYR